MGTCLPSFPTKEFVVYAEEYIGQGKHCVSWNYPVAEMAADRVEIYVIK